MSAPLLVELLTEELPPKVLARLMEALSRGVHDGLKDKFFLAVDAEAKSFATPRRLAVLISNVLDKQPDRQIERKGPALASALDAAGKPTAALLGFAKSCGVDVAKLEKRSGDKGEYFVYCSRQKGEPLKQHLAAIVETALKKLPIPKVMRWGGGEAQFVRPVHGVILLHGRKVVPGAVLGIKSGNKTRGHRFLSKGVINIGQAKDYEKILKLSGKVLASFEVRRDAVTKALDVEANKIASGASWNLNRVNELVDEVTSLVEYPVVLAGGFDKAFLQVPRECLIISMQQHQRYFPLVDKQGKLLPQFLFVSNVKTANPKEIIHGNERVLRARLSDAKFFFEQDKKTKLVDRVPKLANVVYHNKLGSQLERVQRIQKLAIDIAGRVNAQKETVEQAAYLCKGDLLTEMVGEFPELQGIMGKYYAENDDSKYAHVAVAIREHYLPRYAGDALPLNAESISVALADKLDTLVGIYGIGLVPTGDKDPFGLRRQALGVIRILAESKNIPSLDVLLLLQVTRSYFPNAVIADNVAQDLHAFMLERLKPYLREKGFEPDEIDAVVSLNPTRMDQVLPRMTAIKEFRRLPEAQALAAANKRIRNILRQAGGAPAGEVDSARLTEASERKLFEEVRALDGQVTPLLKSGDYAAALKRLAGLRPAVDEFFDKVMVMVDDSAVRQNRLALLNRLSNLFLNVADISRLQS